MLTFIPHLAFYIDDRFEIKEAVIDVPLGYTKTALSVPNLKAWLFKPAGPDEIPYEIKHQSISYLQTLDMKTYREIQAIIKNNEEESLLFYSLSEDIFNDIRIVLGRPNNILEIITKEVARVINF